LSQLAAVLVLAAPAACVPQPEPAQNPFVGSWATADNDIVTLRRDTAVVHQPTGAPIALDRNTCGGVFRFVYSVRSREALTGLIGRQPDLRQKLADLLVERDYPVAELDCDRGDQTYILLNDRQLIAIYRDGDIGVLERLARR
jgi:hypothetical protein